jgi:pimeloyl-ACP methyl ester carboxylesterase
MTVLACSVLGFVVVAGASVVTLWRVSAPSWGESVNFESWFSRVPVRSMAACRCRADQDVEILRPDGIRLAGSIDRPPLASPAGHPAILLLHGNTPAGRKLGVYRVLSRGLADHGFVVLSVDFAGYGESEDAFRLESREALNPNLDARAALQVLMAIDGGNEPLYVVCHSMGCNAGFSVGLVEPAVRAIVAIGPSRRVLERLEDDADNERFWQWALRTRRRLYDRDFPAWYTREAWMEDRRARNLERHLEILSRNPHKPVLLMDGEVESEADRAYLRGYFDLMIEPKAYVTVPRSNLYANTVSGMGLAFYDREVIDRTIDEIVRFVESSDGDDPTLTSMSPRSG